MNEIIRCASDVLFRNSIDQNNEKKSLTKNQFTTCFPVDNKFQLMHTRNKNSKKNINNDVTLSEIALNEEKDKSKRY